MMRPPPRRAGLVLLIIAGALLAAALLWPVTARSEGRTAAALIVASPSERAATAADLAALEASLEARLLAIDASHRELEHRFVLLLVGGALVLAFLGMRYAEGGRLRIQAGPFSVETTPPPPESPPPKT